MKKIEILCIHCTATPEGREVTPANIRSWHMSPVAKGGRGWDRVGYSEMIALDGSLLLLNDYNQDDIVQSHEVTWGATGINSVSRHVVYVGGTDSKLKPKDTRTKQQLETLETYVKFMVLRYPWIKVAGHNQFAAKACPSFDTVSWLRSIGIPEKNIYKKA